MPRALLLGAAQDGGIPHVGCGCSHCATAAARPAPSHRVAALAIVGRARRWWLVDATPDFPEQVRAMGTLPAGILLTHAHVGHYAGLMYLGREGLHSRDLPVWCSEAMAAFLRGNAPWSQLVELGEIQLRPFRSGEPVDLDGELSATPLRVPHRDELADTHAFLVEASGGRRLLYLPDIDGWEAWERDLPALAAGLDYLLLDGTFWSPAEEVPHRDPREIPHPPVPHTMDLLQPVLEARGCTVAFVHLNHSNPLWDAGSAAARAVRQRGFRVGSASDVFRLAAAP